jgi:hypothetical protein
MTDTMSGEHGSKAVREYVESKGWELFGDPTWNKYTSEWEAVVKTDSSILVLGFALRERTILCPKVR